MHCTGYTVGVMLVSNHTITAESANFPTNCNMFPTCCGSRLNTANDPQCVEFARRPIDKAVCVAPLLDGFAKALALLRLVFGTPYMRFSSYKGGLSFTTERFACMLLSNLPIHNMADYLSLVAPEEQEKRFQLVLTKDSKSKSPHFPYGFS